MAGGEERSVARADAQSSIGFQPVGRGAVTRIKGVGRGSARAAARDDPKARAARVLEFSPSLLAVHVAAREYRQDAYATLLAPGS